VCRHWTRPSWKLLGLAGVAGVAATGVVVARKRRAHVDLEPDELRERLRARLAAVPRLEDDGPGSPPQPPPPAVA
jgi:hypothetical protein